MAAERRQVLWGHALVVEATKYPGGLSAAVRVIHEHVDPFMGSRATFAKFYDITDPADLAERDRFRVWALLTTFGEDSADWGVPDSVVPRAWDVSLLRAALTARPSP